MSWDLFQETGQIEVRAVCDAYAEMIDRAKSKAPNAKGFADYKKLLELKEIDVVLNATPDHWHAQSSIDALNAGKDVYVEKPLTLTIEEGPRVVKAARINERVCQVGMQQRSGPHYLQAKNEYIDTGRLGKISLVRTFWHGNTYHLRKAPAALAQKPSNLDWARFLGPVKWRDWDPQQFWNWRAYLDFGGGQVTDLFTHWIDVVHMFMGKDNPVAAVASGGVYAYQRWTHRARHDQCTARISIGIHGDLRSLARARNLTAMALSFAAPKDGSSSIAASSNSTRWAETSNRPSWKALNTTSRLITSRTSWIACARARSPTVMCLSDIVPRRLRTWAISAYVQKRRINFDPVREEILPF